MEVFSHLIYNTYGVTVKEYTHTHGRILYTNTLPWHEWWTDFPLLSKGQHPVPFVTLLLYLLLSSLSVNPHLLLPPIYLSPLVNISPHSLPAPPGHSPQHADVLFLHWHSQRDGVLDESHDGCCPRPHWTSQKVSTHTHKAMMAVK